MQGIKGSGKKPKRKWQADAQGVYGCPYCDHTSTTPQGIGRHVADMHKGGAQAQAKPNGPTLDLSATGFNGSGVAQAAASCAEQQTTGPTPARLGVYLPLSGESLAIRNVCNVAVAFLTDPGWRKLTAERKRDVLAVMRVRLAEEMASPEALLTGEMMAGSLDPLTTTPAPA